MSISLAPLVVAMQLAAAAESSPPPISQPAASLTLAWSTSTLAGAVSSQPLQTPPGWERVDALPPGTRIQITHTSGKRHLYIFRRATPAAVFAAREAGAVGDEEIPKADVTKLVQRDVRDGSADGTAVGALIGFGAAVGLLAVAYANACDTCDPPAFWVLAGPAGGMGAGAGALTGFLIDRNRLGSRVLYAVPQEERRR